MSSRDAILRTLRESLRDAEARSLPCLDTAWVTYPDVVEQFVAAASELPAAVVHTAGHEFEAVEDLAIYRESRIIHSFVDGLSCGRRNLTSPHAAADLDLVIARGYLGVAESGAIWVNGEGLEPRSALFLAQHLVLLLDRRSIVPHLNAAYEQLDVGSHAYGAFIAGPSKTADIEQALVIGAHGPRSLTIVLHS